MSNRWDRINQVAGKVADWTKSKVRQMPLSLKAKAGWNNFKNNVGNSFNAAGEFLNSEAGEDALTGVTAALNGVGSGNHIDAGDGIMGLGAFAGTINPVMGAALSLYGHFMNEAFGSNINWDTVDRYQSKLDKYSRPNFTAQDNTQLLNQINGLSELQPISRGAIGTQGWFNHDVDATYKTLSDGFLAARGSQARMIDDAVNNVEKQNDARIAMNYAAFGGPLYGYIGDGAIAYDMAKDNLMIKMMNAQNKNTQGMNNTFAKGGSLFNTFNTDISFVNAGGSHGENTLGGVPMGMAEDGKFNVVEEGETIFKDYVFSKRLPVPKAIRNKYKMRSVNFSDAFKEYFEKNGLRERPNDPIAKNGLMAFAADLMMSQELVRAKKEMKKAHTFEGGGKIKHDPSKTKENYFNDLYAEGSDYMNALNWYNDPAHTAERDALIDAINKGSFDTDTEKINGYTVTPDNWYELATDYKKGPVHNAILNRMNTIKRMDLMTPIGIPDEVNPIMKMGPDGKYELGYGPWSSRGTGTQGLMGVPPVDSSGAAGRGTGNGSGNGATDIVSEWSNLGNRYRMAGLIANAGALGYNLRDNYRPGVIDEIGDFMPISGTPIGTYAPEFRMDTRYDANQQALQAAATRNAMLNTTAPNKWANVLGADFLAQTAHGQLLRDAAIAQYDNLLKARTFNRETDKYNSTLDLDVAKANLSGRQANENARMQQRQYNVSNYDSFKKSKDASIGAAITGIVDWLNANGRERDNLAMVGALRDSGALASNDAMDLLYNYLAGTKPTKKTKKSKSNGEG